MSTIKGRTQEKQDWIERVIKNDVLTCQSVLVEKLLEENIVSYDEIENFYIDNSDAIEEIEEEIEKLEEKIEELEEAYEELDEEYADLDVECSPEEEKVIREKMDNNEAEQKKIREKIEELEDKKSDLESEDGDSQDVLEWWVVSSWLAENLKKLGEPVLESDYETWWGRTCSGQAISLDHTMDELYEMVQSRINGYQ